MCVANGLSLGSQAASVHVMGEKNEQVSGQGLSRFPNQLADRVAASEGADQQSAIGIARGFRGYLFPHTQAICKCHAFTSFSYFTSVLIAGDTPN